MPQRNIMRLPSIIMRPRLIMKQGDHDKAKDHANKAREHGNAAVEHGKKGHEESHRP